LTRNVLIEINAITAHVFSKVQKESSGTLLGTSSTYLKRAVL
jgi:hypothetical protein